MHGGHTPFGAPNGHGHQQFQPRLNHAARCTAALRAASHLRSPLEAQHGAAGRLITRCAAHAAKSEAVPAQQAASEAAANAAGAAATTAEAAAATTAASASATSTWFQALSRQAASMQQRMKAAVADRRGWQAPRFEMPGMKVDVDMLNPALTTLRNTCRDFWVALPPPVQQAAPYTATAAATFLVTHWAYAGRLRLQERTGKQLQGELTALKNKYGTLQTKYQSQQSQLDDPRAAREVKMAQAVAQATTAAAAAATAASSAAEAAALLLNNKVKVLRA